MADETTSIWSDMWEKAKAVPAMVAAWPKTFCFGLGFGTAIILMAMV